MIGIKAENLFEWCAEIVGPPDTPYQGGIFKFDVTFSSRYPYRPPKVQSTFHISLLCKIKQILVNIHLFASFQIVCKTRIYHCNINVEGKICLDTLAQKWTALMTVQGALLNIQQLLGDPNPGAL